MEQSFDLKDVYNHAKVVGTVASINAIAALLPEKGEVRNKIERNKEEFSFLIKSFNVLAPAPQERTLKGCIVALHNLNGWLLHQIAEFPSVMVMHEEISTLLSLAEQRMILQAVTA